MRFVLASPNAAGTDYTTKSENHPLPRVTPGVTSSVRYEILTTKNPNDVPPEVTEGNLVLNGGPIITFTDSAQHYSPTNWACFVGNPALLSTWSMGYHQFEFPVTAASSSDSNYFQLQKIISRIGTNIKTYAGGVQLRSLHDGDKVTLSFDYISPYVLKYRPRLFIQVTSESETLNCFMVNSDTPVSLSAASTWTRTSYTGTVPDGWNAQLDILEEQGYIYNGYLLFNFLPQGTGTMKVRNIQLNRGSVAIQYTDNPLDELFTLGSASSYIGAREAAIIKNNGNYVGNTNANIYPIIGGKSQTGFWASGTAGDKYQFFYSTDANHQGRHNYAEVYSLPAPDASISEIKQYDILTSKSPVTIAQGGTGQAGTTTETGVSNIITAGTNITIASAAYAVWGKLGYIFITFKSSTAITIPATGNITDVSVGTLVSGKRPIALHRLVGYNIADDSPLFFSVYSDGVVKLVAGESTGAQRTIAANTNMTVTGTFLLA
jgi:hypothetical protein